MSEMGMSGFLKWEDRLSEMSSDLLMNEIESRMQAIHALSGGTTAYGAEADRAAINHHNLMAVKAFEQLKRRL